MNKRSDTNTPSSYINGLESIIGSAEVVKQDDDVESSIFSNLDKLDIDGQIKALSFHEELKRFNQDTKNRSVLARWTFGIISVWLIAVLILLSFNFLSESVYITLLATTTVNIIGLPAIVLRGYFVSEK